MLAQLAADAMPQYLSRSYDEHKLCFQVASPELLLNHDRRTCFDMSNVNCPRWPRGGDSQPQGCTGRSETEEKRDCVLSPRSYKFAMKCCQSRYLPTDQRLSSQQPSSYSRASCAVRHEQRQRAAHSIAARGCVVQSRV